MSNVFNVPSILLCAIKNATHYILFQRNFISAFDVELQNSEDKSTKIPTPVDYNETSFFQVIVLIKIFQMIHILLIEIPFMYQKWKNLGMLFFQISRVRENNVYFIIFACGSDYMM